VKQSAKNPSRNIYRGEIDGLRAVAVISVILYHAQFAIFGRDWFEGGYLGVDIFFVISGYLITRIIMSELDQEGSFSFLQFYERRARRILPTLVLVSFVSLPFAWEFLLPSAFVEYAASVISSIFFASNFFFYFATTEYGAESALVKPFLHTWSLGVEEQFYLVFPIIALIAFRYLRRYLGNVLIVLALLSLGMAQVMEARNPDLNFFLPFGRFWELLIGALLAFRELTCREAAPSLVRKALPALGLVILFYSIVSFDGETPHPSIHTLVPVLGAALVIGFSSRDEVVGKLLRTKPLRLVGLLSYSAYLWHFPIFAFLRLSGGEPSNVMKLSGVVLTLFLSAVSYKMVEVPFRNRQTVSAKMFWVTIGVSCAMLIALMSAIIWNAGYSKRFSTIDGFGQYELDNEKLRRQSWSLLQARSERQPHFTEVRNRVLVVGNSHAKDIFNALYQNIPMFYDFDVLRGDVPQINCFNESIDDYEEVRKRFFGSAAFQLASVIIVSTRFRENAPCVRGGGDQRYSSDVEGLPFLVEQAKANGKTIVLMGNTAEFGKVNGRWVADHIYEKYKNEKDAVYPLFFETIRREAGLLLYKERDTRTDSVSDRVAAIAKAYDVAFLDKTLFICDDEEKLCDAFTENGQKVFYDYGHFTLQGAKEFGEKLAGNEAFVRLISR
jgi:peptidoglycan/LPS O-acetylase OafA/YrhL